MKIEKNLLRRLREALQTRRLIQTAVDLIQVPSPTRSAAAVADHLDELLRSSGLSPERPTAGWPDSPAVVARLVADEEGPTLQFSGHLDTVHLPFVPPRVVDGILYGSGASDMKGGVAAMLEAMRMVAETGLLKHGSLLLTAYDLHESPWGDGSQVDGLIAEGYTGDGVLIPEYFCDSLPLVGRGQAILQIRVSREGEPVHEVLGGIEQPSVIAAGADLVLRLRDWDRKLSRLNHPVAGRESIFVGQVSAGEIYNQSPVEFRLAGSRRWLPGHSQAQVRAEFFDQISKVSAETGLPIKAKFVVSRDGYEVAENHLLVDAFQAACEPVMGSSLPLGAKPFVDDGNAFAAAGVAAITHGPRARGAHTVNEWVPIAELERVALLYALTAVQFCNQTSARCSSAHREME